MVDRVHQWNGGTEAGLPSYLVGGEYIMSGNDNRDNAAYRLDITVSEPVMVYLLVDNRLTPSLLPRAAARAQSLRAAGRSTPCKGAERLLESMWRQERGTRAAGSLPRSPLSPQGSNLVPRHSAFERFKNEISPEGGVSG